MDSTASVGLDVKHQTLPQTSLAEVLRPFACEEVIRDLRTSGTRPHRDFIGVARGCSRSRQLVPIIRKSLANCRYNSSIFFLFDLGLPLIDSAQLNLIEREITRRG